MSVAIVSAWKDHLELAHDYFTAVEDDKPDQLVIVDDGSDPPLEFAATRLDKPGGFCTANNVGLAMVETDIVVFLNNDVALARPGWLQEVLALVEPGVVVAPLRFDPHGNVDGRPFPYGDGWCLAMLTEEMRRLGGWDETYDKAGPAYFSDLRLSFQARLAGMRIRELHPGLMHKGGQTGGTDPLVFQHVMAVNNQLFATQVRSSRLEE